MVRRFAYCNKTLMYDPSIYEDKHGEYVLYSDYARLHEALRECVHQIQCVRDYYPIHPINDPKLVYTLRQAAEALGNENEGGAE